jgi:ferric-dicitrate binding protein FerR (iron transport regulator)
MGEKRLEELLNVADLIRHQLLSGLPLEENIELMELLQHMGMEQEILALLTDRENLTKDILQAEKVDTTAILNLIIQNSSDVPRIEMDPKTGNRLIRIHWYKWVAAAALLLFFSGLAWFFNQTNNSDKRKTDEPVSQVISPGRNRALLQLSNGEKIILDSLHYSSGQQEQFPSIDLREGIISYLNLPVNYEHAGEDHTLITPNGGQYQVILPDGSIAWLNAASSIKFPTVFKGLQRKVSITGEVYFQVRKATESKTGQRQSFLVEAGEQVVEVFGTSFNINAYENEKLVKTTLVEGAVKVHSGKSAIKMNPGQQVFFSKESGSFQLVKPDLDEVLAWKSGKFVFKDADIQSILRQVSRWYNLEVLYIDDLSDIHFSGSISKKDQIEKLIELLELDGRIKLTLQGRKLTVQHIK